MKKRRKKGIIAKANNKIIKIDFVRRANKETLLENSLSRGSLGENVVHFELCYILRPNSQIAHVDQVFH